MFKQIFEVLSLQTVSQFLSVVAKHSQNRVVVINVLSVLPNLIFAAIISIIVGVFYNH